MRPLSNTFLRPLSLLPLALASLSAGASAQNAVVSPAAFAGIEGEGFSFIFGRYAEGRFQFAEGDLRGTPRTFTEVQHRLDYRNHDHTTAMGRKWSQVTLTLADTDYDKMSALWNTNATSTPTQVFRGPIEWPMQTGLPLVRPDVWGSISAKLRVPFTTPYLHSGQADLLLDFDFSGGVLATASPWPFTAAHFYYLDSEQVTTEPNDGSRRSYPPVATCADSGLPQGPAASSTFRALVYSDVEPDPRLRGNLFLYHETRGTAPLAIVIQGLALGGLANGIPMGAGCNSLHLDPARAWVLTPRLTDALGDSGRGPNLGEYVLPWNPILGGLTLWTQGAWADSSTQQFSLTQAASVTVPMMKPPAAAPRKKAVYHYASNVGLGVGPSTNIDVNPFLRLLHK